MRQRERDPERLAAALERRLPRVAKPTRYVGGEVNSVVKDPAAVRVRVALAFPDLYEIGMSHLGFRILYSVLNRLDGVAAERVFMPWTDMLAVLREDRLPLTSLETTTPLDHFDMVGFSLQYELSLTNVLAMLDLGRIPLLAADRRESAPLVLGGGPAFFNPEPAAPFFDLILFGDGEDALPEFVELYARARAAGAGRREIIAEAARLEGWYAPELYEARAAGPLGLRVPRPRAADGAPARVRRRVVYDLDSRPFPADIVVPHLEIVHDRVSWEIMRGCPIGCRFCQAGYVYRPTRERSPGAVRAGVERSLAATGYDEFSLSSLNTGRYGAIEPLLERMMDEAAPRRVSVGLSSLHATTLTENLARQVARVRKTGFTIAPEAGSQRLRDVINKNLTEDDILRAARLAFEAGWDLIKLYFMIGLPTETDEDIDALVALAREIAVLGRRISGPRARVTVSASTFVPKPFTPFQWFGMESAAAIAAKQQRIRRALPSRVQFKPHGQETSWLEGVLSRADRSVADAILLAHRRGAVLDGWSECFRPDLWREAFAQVGIDADRLATQPIPRDAELPWDVVDPLIRRPWLEQEYERSLRGETSPPCGPDACSGCGPFAGECVRGVVAERHGAVRAAAQELASPAATPPEEPAPAVRRFRARFQKLGVSRFLGHLDLARALTMALRRASVPLAYTQGFKPHARISFSPALALGVASLAEYVDFETTAAIDADDLAARLNAALPEGLSVTTIVPTPLTAPTLQDAIRRARYRVESLELAEAGLRRAVNDFLARERCEIVRRRGDSEKIVDLRPLVVDCRVRAGDVLEFTLAIGPEGSAKPAEIVAALAGADAVGRAVITREEQFAQSGERWISPLLAGRGRLAE